MRSSPWRWMVGSRVPTSSIRRRTISSDCCTAACLHLVDRALGQPDVDPPAVALDHLELARERIGIEVVEQLDRLRGGGRVGQRQA